MLWGVSHPATVAGAFGRQRIASSGTGGGVSWNQPLDAGGFVVGKGGSSPPPLVQRRGQPGQLGPADVIGGRRPSNTSPSMRSRTGTARSA